MPKYTYAEPNVSEVYEALLESKETLIQSQKDKIDLLSNTISWIIAISTIVSTIAITLISYIYNILLKDIKKRNEQLKQQEQVIAKIVEAEEFQEKLNKLEENLAGLSYKQETYQRKMGNPDNFTL